MTIDALTDPDPCLLTDAMRIPETLRACEEAHAALARLRFHEGLRRGWEEARAEACVREAVAVALMEGARTTVDELRLAGPMGGWTPGEDPAMDWAIGAWRAQVGLAARFPPLNSRSPALVRPRALPALLAALHRDSCSGLVESGRAGVTAVAMPKSPDALRTALAYADAPAPAIARAAAVSAHFRFREVFAPGSVAVGQGLARRILVDQGVDPSGVAVVSALDATDRAGASEALAGWALADRKGVARWIVRFARSVEYGAGIGADIALRVQAGRLG